MNFIKDLEDTIKKANINYRLGNLINISELSNNIKNLINKSDGDLLDRYYDIIVDKLKELDPKNKLFDRGIIENIDDFSSKRKRKLDHPMYSLNKESNVNDLKKWAKNKGIPKNSLVVATPKYDGVSILRNEITGKSFSRGDGIEGQDITEHYNRLNNISAFMSSSDNLKTNKNIEYSIGELIIPKDIFNDNQYKFVRDNGDVYKNPRNMVAGLVNNDDVSEYWEYVEHLRYGIIDNDYKYNKSEQLELIYNETYGFKVPYKVFVLSELNDDLLDELYYDWGKTFDIDGIVIDIEDKELRKKLGRETNNNPAYARAYKANWSVPVSTTVLYNDWNVSKDGYVKPIVNVDPFDIEGVTVSRATGYNAKFIKENNIGSGTVVDIIRSGSVIPKIVNIKKSTGYDIPMFCPSCKSKLVWNKSGVEIMCINIDCKEKNIKKISFFFLSLGIENFGEQIVSKFYKNGYNTIGSILKMNVSDISKIDGMGELSAHKILDQFDKIKNVSFDKMGHASGCFDNLGSRKLKMIVDGLGGLDKFEDFKNRYFKNGTSDNLIAELNSIYGVSTITARSFMKGLDCFKDFVDSNNIEMGEYDNIEISKEFEGKVFVFTGVRDKNLEEYLIGNGADIKTSVSKNTTDLIVKDVNSTSSKIKKAKGLGINIIQIDDFKKGLNL